MSNFTLSEARLRELWPTFWIYTIQGTLLAAANLLILLPILRYQVLRRKKEYLIMASLAFIDAVNGLACITAGTVRNYWIATGQANTLVSRWDCLFKPWVQLWVLWEYAYGPTLMIVSVDRLIAMLQPLKYYGLGQHYAMALISCVYGPGVFFISLAIYRLSPLRTPEKPIICYSTWVYDDEYAFFIEWLSISATVASILIYIVVGVLMFRQKPPAGSKGQMAKHIRAQRRLTVTLGWSCVALFVFHICPLILKSVLSWSDSTNEFTAILIPWVYIIQNLNPLSNYFVYTTRHKDLKLAVVHFVMCKPLSERMIAEARNRRSMSSRSHQSRSRGYGDKVFIVG